MRRVSLGYAVYFAAIGASFPYLPVYYRSLGLDLAAVGAIAAAAASTQLVVAPIWGGIADAFPRARISLPLAAVVAAGGASLILAAGSFGTGLPGVIAGVVVLFTGVAGIGPVLDARTLETLGADRNRYGQMRAWGSLSFVVIATVVGALAERLGDASIFAVYVPALLLTAVVTATIPRQGAIRSGGSVWRGATTFLATPGIPLFMVGTFLVWTSLNAVNAFYSIQVVALGGGTTLVGLAWAVGALVEVPIMWTFPRLAGRFGTERLLILGAVTIAIRAGLAALSPDATMLVAIAPIEGISFALTYVGGVTYLGGRAPAGLAGTAQGLFAATTGLGTITGSVFGGAIAGASTIATLFGVGAVASLAAAFVVSIAVLSAGRVRTGDGLPGVGAGPEGEAG